MYLILTIFKRSICAIRFALTSHLMQPFRIDGKAKQLAAHVLKLGWKRQALKILRDKGIVGGTDTVLQCEIETRRGLAGAGYSQKNDVCLAPIALGKAVVVLQRVSYCVNTPAVFNCIVNTVGEPDVMGRTHAKFSFHRGDENAEAIEV